VARRFASQAKQDAALAFGSKRSALSEALEEAKGQYGSALASGRTSARLTQQAVGHALPSVDKIYAGAQGAQEAAAARTAGVLGSLPHDPVLDAYRATQAGEGQTQLTNLLAAGAREHSRLEGLGTAAQAGAQFDESSARNTLQKAVTGILAKKQQVSGEEGLFAASETQKLAREAQEAEAKERQAIRSAETSEAGSIRSNETSRANAEEGNAQQERASKRSAATAGSKARGGLPPGYQTADKQDQAAEKINTIKSTAYQRYLKAHPHMTRTELAGRLERGIDSKALKVPSFNKGPLLNAALDEVEHGFVTRQTVKELHDRGYSVKSLALKTVSPQKEADILRREATKALAPLARH
jgi:hypothetical protein